MALKKSIAAYLREWQEEINHEDGTSHFEKRSEWIEQQDVDMHPMEEAEMIAQWAVGESKVKEPQKPSLSDEHEWLLDYGTDYVKQKRAEWKAAHDAWLANHQPLVDAHRKVADEYMKWADSLDKSKDK